MRSAFKKVGAGLAVMVTLVAALFVPSFMADQPSTELATQSLPVEQDPAEDTVARPAPTEITLPTATVVVVAPTQVPTAEPTAEPTPEPTPLPPRATPVPLVVAPTAAPEPTTAPTVAATPTTEPTVEPTVEPTAEPTVEPTAEPTPEPTATVEVLAEATAEPTVEPTVDPGPTLAIESRWLYVTATDGLFVRDFPAGQIQGVLTYRSQTFVTGTIEANGERLWAEVSLPEPGWVAFEFLSDDEPEPPPSTGDGRPTDPPTAAEWAAFRDCESSGRYDIVDPSGLYHGAYQFLPSTWDGLARRFWPELVGVLPSQAAPGDQDKMAMKLFELEGTRPWPVCGRHLL